MIGFYGGEPLLNFELIQQCSDYVSRCEKNDGIERPVHFSLTTNGTLLTEEKVSFFIQHNFFLTVSLDGPRALHNEFRVFADGRGSFDVVFGNLQRIYDRDPDYYHKHLLINCTIPLSNNLLALRDFFDQYDHLFGGKLNVAFLTDGNASFENSYPAYAGWGEDMLRLEQEYIATHVDGKASGIEFHNAFVRQLFEQPYLLLHRRAMPHVKANSLDRLNTCFPGERKVFVDVDGQLHMCERVYRQFPIGDVWHGYDIQKVVDVFNRFSTFMNSTECRHCWAVQMCPHCFTVGIAGRFPSETKEGPCSAYRQRLEGVIAQYCSVLEENPAAFDYMNDYVIT